MDMEVSLRQPALLIFIVTEQAQWARGKGDCADAISSAMRTGVNGTNHLCFGICFPSSNS
jgi:hypothetical protein